MTDIPDDILLHIARFIPDATLRTMLAVNSLFFKLAMDLKYREVYLTSRDPDVKYILSRLLDPAVAKRVRYLRLRLTHVREYQSTSRGSPSNTSFKQLRAQLRDAFNRAIRASSQPLREDPSKVPASFNEMIETLVEAFPSMTNVDQLYIDSWDLPPTYHLSGFFSAAWNSFGRNLRKVSLGGNLEGFRRLIDSAPPFESIRELRIEFTNDLHRVDDVADGAILVDTVAPFINNLAPQLEALRIWSWASVDLSEFFLNLHSFPSLQYLNIRMAFNRAFRLDPSGLRKLLSDTSPTLQTLELRLNPVGSVINPTSEETLCRWLAESISDETMFKNLRSLQLYPTNLAGGIEVLLRSIQLASSHLEHLQVRDRYLRYPDETGSILNALEECKNLVYLHLNVWKLNVALFDIISHKLPRLQRLWIYVGDFVHGEPLGSIVGDAVHQHETPEIFQNEIESRVYSNWELRDLGIWQGGSELDKETMQAIANAIPSLRSFWGNGDMNEAEKV